MIPALILKFLFPMFLGGNGEQHKATTGDKWRALVGVTFTGLLIAWLLK